MGQITMVVKELSQEPGCYFHGDATLCFYFSLHSLHPNPYCVLDVRLASQADGLAVK